MITARRKVGAVFFGLGYGGSLVNGLNTGVGCVVGNREYSVYESVSLGLAVHCLSTVLMGLLAGYVGRSVVLGSLASGIGATLPVVAPGLFGYSDVPQSLTLFVASATAFGMGTIAAAFSRRLKVAPDDLRAGLIFGVSWKHWLWLWLPWQYVIANVIWLGTPAFILTSGGTRFVVGDFVKSAIGAVAVALAGYRALRTLQADGRLTRTRSALQFVAWFLVIPILVNLWRFLL